jgi:hypothetical protein
VKRVLVTATLCLLLLSCAGGKLHTQEVEHNISIINSEGKEIYLQVEVPQTFEEFIHGLGDRTEKLGEHEGMLFDFGEEVDISFTMKNTLIPLSIAFISPEGVILGILDMEPRGDCYASKEKYRYALEVNQGFFTHSGIELGNQIKEFPESVDFNELWDRHVREVLSKGSAADH